jgi:regulatory protein
MPVITEITPQVKCQGYYNIYIDGKYALTLSETDLALFQLCKAQTIDNDLFKTLKQAHIKSKCYNCSLKYLAVRPRSIHELREYLIKRKGYSSEVVDYAIGKLRAQNYLNDTDFARLWIKNRLNLAPRPLSVIKMELLKKGVDKDIIDEALKQIDSDMELIGICELANKRYRQAKYQDKQKLTEFLARRGYKYSLIQQAFEKLALFKN